MAPNAAPPGAALPPNKTKKRKDLHSTRSKKKKARMAFQAPALQDEDGLYIPVLTDVPKLIQVDLFLGNRVCVVHALQRLNDLFPFEEHMETGPDMGAPNTLVASMFKFPDNEDIQTAALGCVVDLSFDEGHDQAKKTFVELGAAEATVNAMLNFSNSNSQELNRRGMGVILNIVIGSKQKQAITRITHRFVADMQGIKMIVTAMGRFSPDPNLCDSACKILCNIAKSKCFYPDLEKEATAEMAATGTATATGVANEAVVPQMAVVSAQGAAGATAAATRVIDPPATNKTPPSTEAPSSNEQDEVDAIRNGSSLANTGGNEESALEPHDTAAGPKPDATPPVSASPVMASSKPKAQDEVDAVRNGSSLANTSRNEESARAAMAAPPATAEMAATRTATATATGVAKAAVVAQMAVVHQSDAQEAMGPPPSQPPAASVPKLKTAQAAPKQNSAAATTTTKLAATAAQPDVSQPSAPPPSKLKKAPAGLALSGEAVEMIRDTIQKN